LWPIPDGSTDPVQGATSAPSGISTSPYCSS
jgi:hypothetical protein